MTWEAVKQKNMQPDIANQRPDEYESQQSGGGWDDEKPEQAPRVAARKTKSPHPSEIRDSSRARRSATNV